MWCAEFVCCFPVPEYGLFGSGYGYKYWSGIIGCWVNGLFQIGVYLQGVNVDLKRLLIFHQAVRVVEITVLLNVLWRSKIRQLSLSALEASTHWQDLQPQCAPSESDQWLPCLVGRLKTDLWPQSDHRWLLSIVRCTAPVTTFNSVGIAAWFCHARLQCVMTSPRQLELIAAVLHNTCDCSSDTLVSPKYAPIFKIKYPVLTRDHKDRQKRSYWTTKPTYSW